MATARSALPDLRARTRGRLLPPDHPAYEASRRTFNAMAGGRPLAIFQPEDTADVVAAVRWAADADVGFGVRGGGHSVAGHSAPDGALLIDLSTWRGAEVDPVGRTAIALAGSRLMDLDAATAAWAGRPVRHVRGYGDQWPDPWWRDRLHRRVRRVCLGRAHRRGARHGGRRRRTSTKSERRNSCGDSAAGEATSAW